MCLRLRRRCALIAATVGCLLWSCTARPGAKPAPNVLLILVDALRADHLGAYGYGRPTSPHVDALAARGTLYRQAHSTTSWTNPAVESLFTGDFPQVLRPGAEQFIKPNTTTLAQAFRSRGYRTGAIIANPALPPDLGFAQGFDSYLPVSGWAHTVTAINKPSAEQVNAAALGWLRVEDHRPWFLYVHYMDTHWPYQPPVPIAQAFWRADGLDLAEVMMPLNRRLRERHGALPPDEVSRSIDLYDAAIAHFDAQLGALLQQLEASGQLANTLVCITADHGEELGDHDGFLHARTLYEEVLHIPLLVVPPGGTIGARIERPVPISDIGRTLLDAAGLQDVPFAGNSRDGQPAAFTASEILLAELMPLPMVDTVHEQALLRGADKLIVTPTGQRLLFDLVNDPGEHRDTSGERPELVAELDRRLAQLRPEHPQQPSSEVSQAVRERMRALGYDF